MYKEAGPRETLAIDLRIVENDGRFLSDMSPIVKKYKEEPVTSKSINRLWKSFYGVIEGISGYKYNVRRCPRLSAEEITRIEQEGKMVVLLAPEIFTPEGLEGLCKVFPLSMGWTTDSKEILNISHNIKMSGCMVTEKHSNAPYTTRSDDDLKVTIIKNLDNMPGGSDKKGSIIMDKMRVRDLGLTPTGGYSERELMKKATSEGRFGLGMPHYILASKMSELITGVPFDVNTFSRIPGSSFKSEALAISTTSNGNFHVFKCPPNSQIQILGVRSGLMIEKENQWWKSFAGSSKSSKPVRQPYSLA